MAKQSFSLDLLKTSSLVNYVKSTSTVLSFCTCRVIKWFNLDRLVIDINMEL